MSIRAGLKAPDFTLPTDQNGSFTLSAYKGQIVILYFYPKDDTSGCTKQACAFNDHLKIFNKLQACVVGISRDSIKKHDKFKEKYGLNFPLASDEDGKVCAQYGVWVEKSMYGRKYMGIERTTFLIDTAGKIAYVWNKVKVDGHIDAVIEKIREISA